MKINHDILRKSGSIKTIKRWLNQRSLLGYMKNRFEWHYFPRLDILKNYPIHVDIELSSLCQLKCPMCFRENREVKGQGNMSFDTFKSIIDEIVGKVYSIKFTGRGEPLINKKFPLFMEYLKDKGFGEVSMITNGQLMTEDKMHAIIDNGLDTVSFSIDGLKEEYERIRKPVKYEEIIDVVSKLHRLRKEKGKKKPIIRIQSVDQSVQNEQKFLDIWKPISDDILFLFFKDYSPDAENNQLDNYTCPLPFQRLMIHYNGTVPMCINDEYEEAVMGDLSKNNIKNIWHGKRFSGARKAHKKGIRVKCFKCCAKCSITREGHGIGA